jgi:hypothetical protein
MNTRSDRKRSHQYPMLVALSQYGAEADGRVSDPGRAANDRMCSRTVGNFFFLSAALSLYIKAVYHTTLQGWPCPQK